ncbi:hypothetical protein [Achromobacter insolitus]|uniref:Uncharacterized protein n=1 Tax=Achromobacter insolitus TaxID=217204 RepID=A0A6S7FAE0_9BURK|nr:hypothetical protein [Achromobacter insolitus]CAB3931586.1 hypothetical protein LMG6000_02228 [Achromobacter insolitus]CAB3939457.1 hypothetical protein LMG5997_04045 [Achromobacter insolitus]
MNEPVKPFRKPAGNWAPYGPEHIDPEVPASVYETIGKIVTQWAKLDDYSVKYLVQEIGTDAGVAHALVGRMDCLTALDKLKKIARFRQHKEAEKGAVDLAKMLAPLREMRNILAHSSLVGVSKQSKALVFSDHSGAFLDDEGKLCVPSAAIMPEKLSEGLLRLNIIAGVLLETLGKRASSPEK